MTEMLEGENRRSTAKALGESLLSVARRHPRVVVCVADSSGSSWLSEFKQELPERIFEFGIAEQNMVAAAAGLATTGLVVFAVAFATFLSLRAFEVIRTIIAGDRLNVKLVGTNSGFSYGWGGYTHQALEDVALMRTVAGMTVIAPADAVECTKAISALLDHPGPAYLRVGREPSAVVTGENAPFEIAQALCLRDYGSQAAVLASGLAVPRAVQAADRLAVQGIGVQVINLHTLKPIDESTVREVSARVDCVITVEEHSTIGGLGSAVAEIIAEEGRGRLVRLGVPDRRLGSCPPTELAGMVGQDVEDIVLAVRRHIGLGQEDETRC